LVLALQGFWIRIVMWLNFSGSFRSAQLEVDMTAVPRVVVSKLISSMSMGPCHYARFIVGRGR
jgi:hypothetical protein